MLCTGVGVSACRIAPAWVPVTCGPLSLKKTRCFLQVLFFLLFSRTLEYANDTVFTRFFILLGISGSCDSHSQFLGIPDLPSFGSSSVPLGSPVFSLGGLLGPFGRFLGSIGRLSGLVGCLLGALSQIFTKIRRPHTPTTSGSKNALPNDSYFTNE